MHTHIHITYIYIYVYMYMYSYIRIVIVVYIYLYTHIHIYIYYVYKHIYIYIYICINVSLVGKPFCRIRLKSSCEGRPRRPSQAPMLRFGRGDDTVGNPHRAQISQFEFFELILLLKWHKQLPVEQFEANRATRGSSISVVSTLPPSYTY